MPSRIVLGCAAAALLLAAPNAHAQGNTAKKHFEAGKKLRDEGRCGQAIAEFEKSIAAEKSIGAYYNLGYCHEQLANRQEAYDAYKTAQQLASAKKDDRLREISGALAALLETPHIRLVLPQPLPDGIAVRVDDQLVPTSYYSAETVIFTTGAKRHSVVVSAPGYEERRELVETRTVKPIELRAAAPEERKPAPSPAAAPSPAPSRSEGGGWTWQHWTGLGVGAAGVALFTVGSVMFISYRIDESNLLERWQQASRCEKAAEGSPTCADARLEADRNKARRDYNDNETSAEDRKPLMLGTVIGGALMVGAGVFLYLTASKSSAEARSPALGLRAMPIVGADVRGAAVGGTF